MEWKNYPPSIEKLRAGIGLRGSIKLRERPVRRERQRRQIGLFLHLTRLANSLAGKSNAFGEPFQRKTGRSRFGSGLRGSKLKRRYSAILLFRVASWSF
jgi:hypothetical protein